MPGAFLLDEARRLVLSRGWGVLTDRELLAQARALAADPRFRPHWSQLADFREVTQLQVTSEGVRKLAEVSPFGAGARRAILVGTDETYGVARMFQMMRSQRQDEIEVFRERNAALEWLGVDASLDAELAELALMPPLPDSE